MADYEPEPGRYDGMLLGACDSLLALRLPSSVDIDVDNFTSQTNPVSSATAAHLLAMTTVRIAPVVAPLMSVMRTGMSSDLSLAP